MPVPMFSAIKRAKVTAEDKFRAHGLGINLEGYTILTTLRKGAI